MARSSSADKYETNVCVSFVATFRATLEFFAKKDVVMLEYHPKPFPHWQRSDRHFNLISTEARRVIRFEGNRFVVRVEGYSSLDPYYETLALARRMCDIFNVADIFSTAFTLTKTHALPSRQESRKAFAKLFLSPLTQDWLPQDGATDYAMTLDRSKTVSPELVEMKPALAPLRLRHQYQIGPSDYNEVGQRFVEFTKGADNESYRTPHVAPDFSILAALKITLERKNQKHWTTPTALWHFHDWAQTEAQAAWDRIAGGLR